MSVFCYELCTQTVVFLSALFRRSLLELLYSCSGGIALHFSTTVIGALRELCLSEEETKVLVFFFFIARPTFGK